MKLTADRPKIVIIAVIVATVIAQIPSVDHWIADITARNTHLVTIVEGIVGVLLLIFATYKEPAGVTK